MKIIHILYSGLGGHGNVFFSMVEADEAKEFDFEALFTGTENVRKEFIDKCKNFSLRYTYVNKIPGQKSFSFFYNILKTILNSKADIIFLHGSMMMLPAWLAKKLSINIKKVVVRETQALHLKCGRDKAAFKVTMKLADDIIILSPEYARQIEYDFGKNFRKEKIHIIPNGINLNFFKPNPKNISIEKKIGMQSRIVPIKDHKTLLAAFKIIIEKDPLQNFKLLIAGDGEMLDELKILAHTLKIDMHITFLGMLNEIDLPDFLNDLDIYVHASFGETMSTAIMQAMACGKATIASDVDGIKNMIKDGEDGLLVEVKNEKILAEKILLLLNDENLKTNLEKGARKKAETSFSNTRMFNSYKRIFQPSN